MIYINPKPWALFNSMPDEIDESEDILQEDDESGESSDDGDEIEDD